MSVELGPTNVIIEAKDIIEPEDMSPLDRLMLMPDGSVKFIMEEEYQDGVYA